MPAALRALAAAFRVQLHVMRGDATQVQVLVLVPLFTIIFLEIVREAGRHDLTSYAVMAPVLIAMWGLSLSSAGEVIEDDRWQGTLELAVASPTPFALVVLGRVVAVTSVAMFAFVEVWIVAWLVFGVVVDVHHPLAFAIAVL